MPFKLTWWKRLPERQDGSVRSRGAAPCPRPSGSRQRSTKPFVEVQLLAGAPSLCPGGTRGWFPKPTGRVQLPAERLSGRLSKEGCQVWILALAGSIPAALTARSVILHRMPTSLRIVAEQAARLLGSYRRCQREGADFKTVAQALVPVLTVLRTSIDEAIADLTKVLLRGAGPVAGHLFYKQARWGSIPQPPTTLWCRR